MCSKNKAINILAVDIAENRALSKFGLFLL